jgi:hypothetical protein
MLEAGRRIVMQCLSCLPTVVDQADVMSDGSGRLPASGSMHSVDMTSQDCMKHHACESSKRANTEVRSTYVTGGRFGGTPCPAGADVRSKVVLVAWHLICLAALLRSCFPGVPPNSATASVRRAMPGRRYGSTWLKLPVSPGSTDRSCICSLQSNTRLASGRKIGWFAHWFAVVQAKPGLHQVSCFVLCCARSRFFPSVA